MTSTIEIPRSATRTTGLERTRYFPRQLVTSDDLTQDQQYLRERLRRHNRLLHGWGIVCGARVREAGKEGQVVVSPGYILGPYGDDIFIEEEVSLNVCRSLVDDTSCGQPKDPWCGPVIQNSSEATPLYLAVKFSERLSRPVRVLSGGCGCEDDNCEYSRYQDSFEIGVLTELPSSYDPMPGARFSNAISCENTSDRSCVPCPADPWVILANILIDADCSILKIDNKKHRRYVASFAAYYFTCEDEHKPPVGTPHGDWVFELDVEPHRLPVDQVLVEVSPNRWSFLPIHFTVVEGDTFGSLLGREGDRQFVTSEAGTPITLNELYTKAGVDLDKKVHNLDEAIAPLEGVKFSKVDDSLQREAMLELLDKEGMAGLEKEHGGRLSAAGELSAAALRGLGKTSALGEKLSNMRIQEVAEMKEAEYLDLALSDVEESRKKAVEKQALEVRARAQRVMKVVAL